MIRWTNPPTFIFFNYFYRFVNILTLLVQTRKPVLKIKSVLILIWFFHNYVIQKDGLTITFIYSHHTVTYTGAWTAPIQQETTNMTKYKVEWAEAHDAIVEADNPEDALQKALEIDDTFDKVLKSTKATAFKTRQVTWIEHHICEVDTPTNADAIEAAKEYAGGHDTCGDCDHYEVMEA